MNKHKLSIQGREGEEGRKLNSILVQVFARGIRSTNGTLRSPPPHRSTSKDGGKRIVEGIKIKADFGALFDFLSETIVTEFPELDIFEGQVSVVKREMHGSSKNANAPLRSPSVPFTLSLRSS